jgi:hypothetical protein
MHADHRPDGARPGGALPDHVVEQLAPFVDPAALRAFRARTGRPWSLLPTALRASATTLGRSVLFRDGAYRTGDPRGLALIAHEAVHVRQFRELGVLRFLYRYAVGAVRVRFRHDAHEMEQEPLRVQAQVRRALTDAE